MTSPKPGNKERARNTPGSSIRGRLRQQFLKPSTYLLWAWLLWFTLPDESWSSSLPQAPLANLFGDQLLWFRIDPLAPSLWMVLWLVLPILVLREAGRETISVAGSFATAALTWWTFWIPILVLAVLRGILGADIPIAPAIAGFLGLLSFTSLLLALLFATAELFGNPRTSWGKRAMRAVTVFALPHLLLQTYPIQFAAGFDFLEALRGFTRGTVEVSWLLRAGAAVSALLLLAAWRRGQLRLRARLALVAGLSLVAYLSGHVSARPDWTPSQVYALHPQSRAFLEQLSTPIKVEYPSGPYWIWGTTTREFAARVRKETSLVELKPAVSGLLVMGQGGIELRSEFGKVSMTLSAVSRSKFPGFQAQAPESLRMEAALLSMFAELSCPRPRVGIYTGQEGERLLSSGEPALARPLEAALRGQPVTFERSPRPWELEPRPEVLVVPVRRMGLNAEEVQALDTYLQEGGGVLLLLRWSTRSLAPAPVGEWLAGLGVEVGESSLQPDTIDPRRSSLATFSTGHISTDAAGLRFSERGGPMPFYAHVRSLRRGERVPLHLSVEEIVFVDPADPHLRLPQRNTTSATPVAVAVEFPPAASRRRGRLLAYGAEWFQSFESLGGSPSQLPRHSLNWLLHRYERIDVPPKEYPPNQFLEGRRASLMAWLTVGLLLTCCLRAVQLRKWERALRSKLPPLPPRPARPTA